MVISDVRCALWLSLVLPCGAWSQAAPDAGSLRQQIEQQGLFRLPTAQPRRATSPALQPKVGASLNVTISSYRFVGNRLLSDEQLESAVNPYRNRPLNLDGLQGAASAVVEKYRQAGWLARVYLPEQELGSGTVTLQVVEVRFAGARVQGEPSKTVMPSEIQAYLGNELKPHQAMPTSTAERAVLLLDDLPGIRASGTLVPDEKESTTALVLNTQDEPSVDGGIGLDNTGPRSIGSTRLSADMNINSPGRRGERLGLSALRSEGSDYALISLTVPDGHHGLRLGVHASTMTFKLTDGPDFNRVSPIRGRSSSMGIDWSYPWLRSHSENLYFYGGLGNKGFTTRDTQLRSDYETNSLRVGLAGNRYDDLWGGGTSSASAQWTRGQLTSVLTRPLLDNLDRHYSKINYHFTRQQDLSAAHALLVSLKGQHATKLLDSSEKLYVGGIDTVRAYPAGELGGDRGQVLTAEWRWRVAPAWVLGTFADLGRVVSLASAPSEQKAAMRLRGQGVSLAWQGPMGMTAQLTWAHRSGDNPRPTYTGTDNDGTLKSQRFWLASRLPF